MNPTAGDRRPANPFATRHVRPGRVEPLGPAGHPLDCDGLLERLDWIGGSGMILGPHGSGKSTLLERLIERLRDRNRFGGKVRVIAGTGMPGPHVPRENRSPPRLLRAITAAPAGTVVCLDGWERLHRALRWGVIGAARLLGRGLLVTGHRTGPLPVLIRMEPSSVLLAAVVDRLPDALGLITPADVESAYTGSRGNMREALFDLYDLFERRADRLPGAGGKGRSESAAPIGGDGEKNPWQDGRTAYV